MPHKSTISIIIALFTVASVPRAVLAQEAVGVDSVVNAAIVPAAVPADSAADPAYIPPIPTARTKYVAVVETDIDEHSGAAAELSRADVRLVTAELRREAVKNLPRGRFNVMTTETVYAENALRSVWVKIGGGIDLDLTRTAYLRAEALYGARTPNWFETDNSERPRLGHGLTVKAGAGFRT